ncbi:ATP-dependent nuclease [Roseateles sp. DB2]|uniref:ATP-dependent nuclease n=1 Tax=Roseateles sp. DB2 TaxID=3453717 RepID=UPI003EEEF19C
MENRGYVRLSDYRCFRREAPATLEIGPGFTGFIGANNAGKSTLIRSLREIRPFLQNVSTVHQFVPNIPSFLGGKQAWSLLAPMHDHAEVLTEREDPRCFIEVGVMAANAVSALWIKALRLELQEDGRLFTAAAIGSDGAQIRQADIKEASDRFIHTQDGGTYDALPMAEFVEALCNTLFIGAFRNAINEGAGTHYDIHVGTSFIDQWNNWKVGASKTDSRAIQRVTDEVKRLIGANELEINASTHLKTLQVSINGRVQRLQELGSGIAQLIVVLGNAAIRKPAFIVIDEPELNLHPGLQIDFLTSLASFATHGVLYATHSIGLARAVSDKCFTVQQGRSGSVVRELGATRNYAEFLGSLGIAGLSELGWDRLLLVEGPKDVRTAQQFLRLYGKDRNTVVLPLGGDGMANGSVQHELQEVRRICPNVHALVDSERASEGAEPIKARRDFKASCEQLEINCHVTERRAIENYFTETALRSEFGDDKAALGWFDPMPSNNSFIGKSDGWRVARRMFKEDLDATDLGAFFQGI